MLKKEEKKTTFSKIVKKGKTQLLKKTPNSEKNIKKIDTFNVN